MIIEKCILSGSIYHIMIYIRKKLKNMKTKYTILKALYFNR